MKTIYVHLLIFAAILFTTILIYFEGQSGCLDVKKKTPFFALLKVASWVWIAFEVIIWFIYGLIIVSKIAF